MNIWTRHSRTELHPDTVIRRGHGTQPDTAALYLEYVTPGDCDLCFAWHVIDAYYESKREMDHRFGSYSPEDHFSVFLKKFGAYRPHDDHDCPLYVPTYEMFIVASTYIHTARLLYQKITDPS